MFKIISQFTLILLVFRNLSCLCARRLSVLIVSIALGVAVADAAPYSISADGQEVTDSQTGLIWRRCAEGASWNGAICTGTVTPYTHEQALQQAASVATATGIAWRLPNIKELESIVDETGINPAIDSVAFPDTPNDAFWSSSPYVGDPFSPGLLTSAVATSASTAATIISRFV